MAVPARLVHEALELPSSEREELLRALLDSLDEPGEDDGHAAAWDAEIQRRARDDDNGSAEMIVDGPEVLRKLRSDVLGS